MLHDNLCVCVCVCVLSVMSDSSWPQGLQPVRFLCPWEFSGKNTEAGCHWLLQKTFPTQGLNPCLLHLLHWQEDSWPLSHQRSPAICIPIIFIFFSDYFLSLCPWICLDNRYSAAAAAAKSLQSCLTLCDPIDGSPPGSSALGILQARTLEQVAISFSNAWKWKVISSQAKCQYVTKWILLILIN